MKDYITETMLKSAKDWDIQLIPDYALDYIRSGDADEYAKELEPEDIKNIIEWECNMIKKGFEPDKFIIITWDIDSDEYVFKVDNDPVPAFVGNPAFGLPCGVYRVFYHKIA